MNQQQRSYALGRIIDIQKEKIAEVKARFTTPEKELSEDETLALVRAGKVKLRTDVYLHRYTDLNRAFDFSKYEHPQQYDAAKGDPIVTKINRAAGKASDIVMLGIEAKAADAITKFIAEIEKL